MEHPPKTDTPAIGYSITANVNGDRQIVFQHFVDAAAGQSVLDAGIDLIMSAVDRQQAKYKIPELQDERRRIEGELALAERDLTAVEADFQAAGEARDMRVIELRAAIKEEHDAGYAEHVSGGRQSTYKPVGHRKANIERLNSALVALVEEAGKQASERAVAVQNLEANNNLRKLRLKQIDAQIADLQAKVN